MHPGYVYILTNPCIRYSYKENGKVITISPVKIGMAKDVEKRLGTLNTSLPENFEHHMSVFSNDPKAVENVVHRLLERYRIATKDGERTEFFRCTVEAAVRTLKQTAKDMHLKEYKIKKAKLVGRSSSKIKANSSRDGKRKSGNSRGEAWVGKTQLAKLIARRGGNEGAYGGILLFFSRKRPCVRKSKWRKALEDAGMQFDANDFVMDWSVAKNPL